jgi:hypothetical protein
MADPNVKTFQISGTNSSSSQVPEMGSGPDQDGGGTRKRQRKPRAASKTYKLGMITKEGGGATSPGTIVQMSASQTPSNPGLPAPVGATSALTDKGSPTECLKGGGGKAVAAPAPAAAPAVKVVLAAPKKKKGKVVLAAAKPLPTPTPTKPSIQTRKAARKVRVSMKSLSKKIHRAKTIRKEATDTTLEHVKKALHKAGLIKAESKAPETILRQMYADFLTLKSRAL